MPTTTTLCIGRMAIFTKQYCARGSSFYGVLPQYIAPGNDAYHYRWRRVPVVVQNSSVPMESVLGRLNCYYLEGLVVLLDEVQYSGRWGIIPSVFFIFSFLTLYGVVYKVVKECLVRFILNELMFTWDLCCEHFLCYITKSNYIKIICVMLCLMTTLRTCTVASFNLFCYSRPEIVKITPDL